MKLGPTTRTPPTPCPQCGAVNDTADGVEHEEAPTPGDISVCMYCAAVTVFTNDLKLRTPTSEEMANIRSDAEIWATIKEAQRAIHAAFSSRRASDQ